MLYIFRSRNSNGARDLTEGILLLGTMARRTKGQMLRTLTAQDAVVCWGDHFAAPNGIRTLNNVAPLNKFNEALKLKAEGVPTVQVSRTKPAAAAGRPAVAAQPEVRGERPAFSLGPYLGLVHLNARQTDLLYQDLQRHFEAPLPVISAAVPAQPAVPGETWLPRKNNHVGGNDLLVDNLQDADFYSKKEDIVEEYRLHMFKGKSIRAGKKTQKATRPDGRTAPHQWIRSLDAGWFINYEGFQSTKPMRKLAADALKALGLDFGAVDMAKKADGTLIVLEVNRAPGLEGNTIRTYAQKIIQWYNGAVEQAEEE